MKRTTISAFPEIFSLRGNSYERFAKINSAQMANDRWNAIGGRLYASIKKVTGSSCEVDEAHGHQKTKTTEIRPSCKR